MKCLIEICFALEASREAKKGSVLDALTFAYVTEFEKLIGDEAFVELDAARDAINSGYYKFLAELHLISLWLMREAKRPDYVSDMTKKELRDFESKHRKNLKLIEQELVTVYGKQEVQKMQKQWAEEEKRQPPRIRCPFDDTDLPTKQMVRQMHQAVFAQNGWWPAQSQPRPAKVSKIWEDAGLAGLQPGHKTAQNPCLAERVASLKAYLNDSSS